MFGIALFVAAEYFIVGVIIAIASILMGLVWPIAKSLGHVLTSPRLHDRRSRSVAVTFGGIAVLSAALFLAPVPLHTVSEGVIWLPEESFVRAAADGDFKRLLVAPGEGVKSRRGARRNRRSDRDGRDDDHPSGSGRSRSRAVRVRAVHGSCPGKSHTSGSSRCGRRHCRGDAVKLINSQFAAWPMARSWFRAPTTCPEDTSSVET